jgi:hypothetical protein
MATLALTIPAGRGGADLRRFAEKIQEASMNVPDQVSTGAALTVTIDNAPSTGFASVVISGAGLATQTTYTE